MDKFIKEWVPYIAIIIIVILIRTYIVTPVIVRGDSMYNTLEDGEVLFLSKITYRVSDIKRFDIVVVKDLDEDLIIKRVIGLPGDSIEYKEGVLYINDKTIEFKKEDKILYAIYGTPAENLCGLQIEQFRKKYGVVEGVSSREYVSNSFHCGVWEDISGIQKQDLEERFWELCKGGRIQYVRYNLTYNTDAMITYIERAMDKGFYEGVNLSLAFCNKCGHEDLDMDVCPKCGNIL